MRQTQHNNDDGPVLDSEKLTHSLLFFLRRLETEHSTVGRLMALLYLADFDFYEQFERPITGARYRKLRHGPESDGVMLLLADLERQGRIRRQSAVVDGLRTYRYAGVEDANLSEFTDEELSTLNRIALQWTTESDENLMNMLAAEAPLLAVKVDDDIPYYLAHYRNNYGSMQLDDDELRFLRQLAVDAEATTQ